jgi:hypothetical protein
MNLDDQRRLQIFLMENKPPEIPAKNTSIIYWDPVNGIHRCELHPEFDKMLSRIENQM